MKSRVLAAFLATLMIGSWTTAQAENWSEVLGEGLVKMFANKTHTWTEDGVDYTGYYESAGQMMLLEGTDIVPSHWRVYGGKSVCIVSRIDENKRCYEYETDGAGKFRMNLKDNESTTFDLEVADGIKEL